MPPKIVRRSASSTVKPEHGLIAAILNTGGHGDALEAGVTSYWFHSLRDEWEFIDAHFARHRKVPSVSMMRSKFPGLVVPGDINDLRYYIEAVKENHAQHVLLTTMEETTADIRSGKPIVDVVKSVSHEFRALESDLVHTDNSMDLVRDWEQPYRDALARVERAKQGNGMMGIPTGIAALDEFTGGIDESQYWVIGARLGNGKSWVLLQAACSALMHGKTVLFFSMEMSKTMCNFRLHNLLSGQFGQQVFKSTDLARGRGFSPLEYRKFLKDMERQVKGNLIVDDTGRRRLTPQSIATNIERKKPDLVCIDYLQLMTSTDWQTVRELSADIQSITHELHVPIFAASQINRAGITHLEPPGPEHLTGSDGIGMDIDALVTMTKVSRRVARMKLAKFRHGPDGQKWWMKMDLGAGKLEEVNPDIAQDLRDEDAMEDEES